MTEKEMIDALSNTSKVEIDDNLIVTAYDDADKAMKSYNANFGEDFSKKQQKLIDRVKLCRALQTVVLVGMVFVGVVDLFTTKNLTIVNLILLFVMVVLSWCIAAFERDYWKNIVSEKDAYTDFLFKEFYCNIITTERRSRTFKRVYEDAYRVMSKFPVDEIETARRDVGVDFSYLQKETDFLEKIVKRRSIK